VEQAICPGHPIGKQGDLPDKKPGQPISPMWITLMNYPLSAGLFVGPLCPPSFIGAGHGPVRRDWQESGRISNPI